MAHRHSSSIAAGLAILISVAWLSITFAAPAIPDYPIAYAVPEVEQVEAAVARVHDYIVTHSSLKIIDRNTRREIASPDFEKFNTNAIIDSSLGPFNRWDYPIGVILTSFDHLAGVTGKPEYRDYNMRFFNYTFTWMPCFRAMQEKTGRRNDYSRMAPPVTIRVFIGM